MQLPDDARIFRDLSLLHDTALSVPQRAALAASIPEEVLQRHEKYVQGLLGGLYTCSPVAKKRAKTRLFAWMTK